MNTDKLLKDLLAGLLKRQRGKKTGDLAMISEDRHWILAPGGIAAFKIDFCPFDIAVPEIRTFNQARMIREAENATTEIRPSARRYIYHTGADTILACFDIPDNVDFGDYEQIYANRDMLEIVTEKGEPEDYLYFTDGPKKPIFVYRPHANDQNELIAVLLPVVIK